MEKICTRKKWVYGILFLIIIIGTICYFTNGFVLDMKYSKKDQIVLSNNTGFDFSKISEISNEVLSGKKTEISEVDIFKNAVAISASEITEEEKEQIIDKVNQEYGLEISKDNIKIQNIEKVSIKDIVAPYILPIVITFALNLLYFLIRYKKLGLKKVLITGIILPIFVELDFLSIVVITKIPFGDLTIALALAIYAIMLMICASIFEKEVEEFKENETEKNRN